jgi:hypothetical protein
MDNKYIFQNIILRLRIMIHKCTSTENILFLHIFKNILLVSTLG